MLSQLLEGAWLALNPPVVYWLILGAIVGLIFGVLPAIGATTGVILFLPFTYGMDLATAVVFLMAIYATGQYGDSVASILLNTPGGPGTVPSCWDGYPMARQGKGARALGIATLGSMLGGVAGTIGLVALAFPLTALALLMQPPEYFALGVMALSLISIAAKGETLKGLIMACLGLILSFVGEDPVSGFIDRFSYGVFWLAGGLPPLTIFVGLFAIAQIIRMLQEGDAAVRDVKVSSGLGQVFDGFRDVLARPMTVLRSIGIGMYIGILPALGVTTATVTSYLVEKRYSPDKERFGHGAPGGLISAEVAKGCCVVGDMIPTFTLGIPGSITGAIVLAAFVLHGIQPGPAFLTAGSTPYIVFAGIALAQILIVLVGPPLIRYFGHIIKAPSALLAPVLAVLCFIGAFVERNIYLDMGFLLAFGLLGYVIDRLGYSAICLILGIILGPLLETNFHRTLSMGFGSPYMLWTRPLTVAFFIITFLFLAWPYLKGALSRVWRRPAPAEDESGPTQVDAVEEASASGVPVSRGEILLLGAVAAVGTLVLVTSLGYPTRVGMFPILVSSVMILFIAWRLSPVWLRRASPVGRVDVGMPRISPGSMSWHWTMVAMITYFLAMMLIGFLPATAIFVAAIPFMVGYRSRLVILIFAVAVTVSVAIFARFLGVILPGPSW